MTASAYRYIGSGRAKCQTCGGKILKGELGIEANPLQGCRIFPGKNHLDCLFSRLELKEFAAKYNNIRRKRKRIYADYEKKRVMAEKWEGLI
jgi:hypothetical protein